MVAVAGVAYLAYKMYLGPGAPAFTNQPGDPATMDTGPTAALPNLPSLNGYSRRI